MISKRIPCQAGNDNYGRLADYIADADHQGEKSLLSWCAGCWAGDDYELAMQEVADTQALNTRSSRGKTYHLVVSFRPEDESRLTPEVFKAIEERFAQALGLSEHQRHCGVHVNTENMHMHTALAYMAAKWGVKRRAQDRASGESVYTLASGQKVLERAGRNVFERPATVQRQRGVEPERPRSRGMGR